MSDSIFFRCKACGEEATVPQPDGGHIAGFARVAWLEADLTIHICGQLPCRYRARAADDDKIVMTNAFPHGSPVNLGEPPTFGATNTIQIPARSEPAVPDISPSREDIIRKSRDNCPAIITAELLHLKIHLPALVFVEFASRGDQQLIEPLIGTVSLGCPMMLGRQLNRIFLVASRASQEWTIAG